MNSLRVVSLQAANILRLSAVDFAWKAESSVLTLGGKNGAGKSSVINAVAMALGGLALCPEEPLKRGEQRGFVELNLGELVVKREFWRDVRHVPGCATLQGRESGTELPVCTCTPICTDTKSRLVVKNAEGVKQEPAQRLLDRLVGKMTFDPTAFVNEEPKRQDAILRQIVGLDVELLDERRKLAFDKRAYFNRQHRDQLVILDAMPQHANVPDVEVSVADIASELKTASVLNEEANVAERAVSESSVLIESAERRAEAENKEEQRLTDEIERLTKLRKEAQRAYAVRVDELVVAKQLREDRAVASLAARARVPDVTILQQKITDVEETNKKIRANQARIDAMNVVVELEGKATAEDDALKAIDVEKAEKLRAVIFPVEGLGLSDLGVTFNGMLFSQASTAEQIRVSVAIGFALNPTLKLLCVKNGNALDDDSMALLADAASKAGGQVLMEYVTKDAGDVSVFIEDGHN